MASPPSATTCSATRSPKPTCCHHISTVKAKTGLKNVAVLYGNDDVFTKSGYDNFKKALEDQKIPVTTTETFARATWTSRPS